MEKTNIYNITKAELMSVEMPLATRTFKPISHADIINLTLESIYASGFELESETYTSARNNNVANAKYIISNVEDKDMRLQIVMQNSLDKMYQSSPKVAFTCQKMNYSKKFTLAFGNYCKHYNPQGFTGDVDRAKDRTMFGTVSNWQCK